MKPRRSNLLTASVAAIVAGGLAGALQASTFNWVGGFDAANLQWEQSSNWDRVEGDTGSIPNAPGAVANIVGTITANREILPPNAGPATVGVLNLNVVNSGGWPAFRIMRYSSTTSGLRFDNNGNGAVLAVMAGSNNQIGGNDNNQLMHVHLDDSLLITNGTSNNTAIQFVPGQSKITGSNDLTIQAGGAGLLTTTLGGTTNDFIGTVRVDGFNSRLDLRSNEGLGNAANLLVLQNGGRVFTTGTADSTFTLSRAVAGNGTLTASTNVSGTTPINLTLDDGGSLSPGESIGVLNVVAAVFAIGSGGTLAIELQDADTADLVNVTGAVVLGGTLNVSTLGLYNPVGGESWTILTATGGISGDFDSALPQGYSTNIVGNDLVLSYIPEPASLLFVAAGGLVMLSRRRQA